MRSCRACCGRSRSRSARSGTRLPAAGCAGWNTRATSAWRATFPCPAPFLPAPKSCARRMAASCSASRCRTEQPLMAAAVDVLGYSVAPLTLEEAAGWLLGRCRAGTQPALVVTLNPEIVVQARSDARLEAALQSAALTVADGV